MATFRTGATETAADIDGHGEPLILIHGGEADRRMFRTFAPTLADKFTVVRYDQRDTGDTRNDSVDYVIDDLGDDCAELIDALGSGPAHVAGFSFGGFVAMSVALRHPDRVKTLTLAATGPGGVVTAADNERLRSNAEQVAQAGPDERDRRMTATLLSDAFREAHPEVVAEIASILVTRPPEATARRRRAWLEFDYCERLSEIGVPALVAHGADDPLISTANATFMADQIPGAVLRLIDGARHGLSFEHPNLLASYIAQLAAP